MKEEILRLRAEGKSYNEISKILGCDKSLICYHCGEGQKEKFYQRSQKSKKDNPINLKLSVFRNAKSKKAAQTRVKDFQRNRDENSKMCQGRVYDFTLQDVLDKVGNPPICALTGQIIDMTDSSSYSFDHIIPISRGGDNTLDNLQLTTSEANIAKRHLLENDFIGMCKKVLLHRGYKVEDPPL